MAELKKYKAVFSDKERELANIIIPAGDQKHAKIKANLLKGSMERLLIIELSGVKMKVVKYNGL